MPHGLQQHFWGSVLKLKGRIMQNVSILESPCCRRNWEVVPVRTESNWQRFLVQRARFMESHSPGMPFHWHLKALLWLTGTPLIRKVPTFSQDRPYQHHSLSSPGGTSKPARFERRRKKIKEYIIIYVDISVWKSKPNIEQDVAQSPDTQRWRCWECSNAGREVQRQGAGGPRWNGRKMWQLKRQLDFRGRKHRSRDHIAGRCSLLSPQM